MTRITEAFARCKAKNEGALVCYLTAGFPDEARSVENILACVKGGADIIEIGVPFSDPVADGKVIQETSQRALEQGMTPLKVFDLVSKVRAQTDVPIVLMGYYNPIFRIGEARYVELASKAGVDGLIVPDLPMEESSNLSRHAKKVRIDLIQLIGPTTPEDRMRKIASSSRGFVYLISSLGTTGERGSLDPKVGELIARAKRASGAMPVGVGFGISRPEHVSQVIGEGADGAIIGSALLSKIVKGASSQELEEMVRTLRSACRDPQLKG